MQLRCSFNAVKSDSMDGSASDMGDPMGVGENAAEDHCVVQGTSRFVQYVPDWETGA
jgi:hypothetical protein